MNEFLCHKFLITDHASPDRKDDFYTVHEADDRLKYVTTPKSVEERQHRLLLSDVGSRQYKTWLTKVDRLSTRETRQSPQRYGYVRPPYQSFNSTAFKYKPYHRTYEQKFMTKKNRPESYAKPSSVSRNRFRNNWKRKTYHKLRQPQFYRIYDGRRETDSSDGLPPLVPTPAPPPPPLMMMMPASSSAIDNDKSTQWYVSTEPSQVINNVTMKMMNYNFWDMLNGGPGPSPPPPSPPSYGQLDDGRPNYDPSPPFYGSEIITHNNDHSSDDHPVQWSPLLDSQQQCDCNPYDGDGDREGDDDDDDDDGSLAKLINSDMYQTALIVFAFIGFTTFFMNVMSGLNQANNSQMPSIMFVGNDNEENDGGAKARKFARVKHEIYLNNLMERSLQYIEQFQEILSSMSDGKT